jgi:hypothetical protein
MEIITTWIILIQKHQWKSLPLAECPYSSSNGNHYHSENFYTATQMEIITTWRISIHEYQWKALPLGEFPYSSTNGNHYHWENFHAHH